MKSVVCVVEFAISQILYISTIVLIVGLFVKGILSVVAKKSPPLLLVLAACLLKSLLSTVDIFKWYLLIAGVIDNTGENTLLIFFPGWMGFPLDVLYDVSMISLFVQRIFILLRPSKSARLVNALGVFSAVSASLLIGSVALYEKLSHLTIRDRPIPEGCCEFSCAEQWEGTAMFITRMCMYVSTTVIGCIFLICFYRFKKVHAVNKQSMINSCVKYTFLIRTTGAIVIVLAVEIAFQCGINLADVLGPYGALAGSAAVFMCTLIDFAVLWESKASVVSVKSLPNK